MTEKPRKKPAKTKPVPPTVSEPAAPQDEDWELSKAQIREIERRVRDIDDPRRFVLASELLPSFVLYYDVSNNVYVMNDLSAATVFKKRKAAVAIKALLGKGVRIVECLKLKSGKLKRVTPVRGRKKKPASLANGRAGGSARTYSGSRRRPE
jgi:hypothetical protein